MPASGLVGMDTFITCLWQNTITLDGAQPCAPGKG